MPAPSELWNPNPLYPCPRCGRELLVKVTTSRYRCLWCRFDRDLEQAEGGILLLLITGLFLVLLFLL